MFSPKVAHVCRGCARFPLALRLTRTWLQVAVHVEFTPELEFPEECTNYTMENYHQPSLHWWGKKRYTYVFLEQIYLKWRADVLRKEYENKTGMCLRPTKLHSLNVTSSPPGTFVNWYFPECLFFCAHLDASSVSRSCDLHRLSLLAHHRRRKTGDLWGILHF